MSPPAVVFADWKKVSCLDSVIVLGTAVQIDLNWLPHGRIHLSPKFLCWKVGRPCDRLSCHRHRGHAGRYPTLRWPQSLRYRKDARISFTTASSAITGSSFRACKSVAKGACNKINDLRARSLSWPGQERNSHVSSRYRFWGRLCSARRRARVILFDKGFKVP